MSSLNRFWQAFELVPGLATSVWEWRNHFGPDFCLASRFLRRNGDLVECLPLGPGEPHRIVVHSVGNTVAIAPGANGTTCVADDDVAVLAVNPRALRKELATVLSLRTSTTTIQRIGRFRVGTWEPQPSTTFPVIFVARHDTEAYDAAMRELADTLDGPAIVLVPTLDLCSDNLIEAARRWSTLVVPLNDILVIDGDDLSVTDAWPDHLGAFCQLAGVTLPSAYSNKRPKRKRASRTADIEAIKKELIAEIRSRRGLLRHAEDEGRAMELPARPTRTELANRAGIPLYTVSRCFSDSDARELTRLYDMLECPEDVLRFGR